MMVHPEDDSVSLDESDISVWEVRDLRNNTGVRQHTKTTNEIGQTLGHEDLTD